jgi:uncharacterized membrane protein YeiH
MDILFILEIIGTVAFAISGAMVAMEKKMDIFGVIILGMTTAVGGGIMRDLLLGNTPPAAFRNPVYAVVSMVTSLVVFLPSVRQLFQKNSRWYELGMLWMDSIGLGVFTVIGIQVAFSSEAGYNYFLGIFVGVVTGVGGGILRDLFAGDMPYIFVRHFYASASLGGALVCALGWTVLGGSLAMIAGAVITLILRLLAAHYHWSLPKAR